MRWRPVRAHSPTRQSSGRAIRPSSHIGLYDASATDQPHNAYEPPSTPATHQRPPRSVSSRDAIAAAADAIFTTVTTYTARSMRSRGKTPTSSANGLVR